MLTSSGGIFLPFAILPCQLRKRSIESEKLAALKSKEKFLTDKADTFLYKI
jgi:hypothetical protein